MSGSNRIFRRVSDLLDVDTPFTTNGALVWNGTKFSTQLIVGGSGAVASVNGRTGIITLASIDVGLNNVTNAAQLVKASNLSDLTSAATARTNLGLGSAALANTSAFDTAGAAATVQGNLTTHLADISNPHSTTKGQVGLSAVTNALQLVAASNLSDLASASTARTNLGLGSIATHSTTDFDATGTASAVQSNLTTHTSDLANPHATTKTQVGLSNVSNALQLVAASNLFDLTNASTARTNLGLGTVATLNTGTASGNIPILGAGGKLATSTLPSIAINDTFTVVNQAAMLALTAERGDLAIRSDTGQKFWLSSDSPATLADWIEIQHNDLVSSVNGHVGVVALNKTDIGLPNVLNVAQEPAITVGTTAQYLRGDKSWQTLNATAVGLAAVLNAAQLTQGSNLSDLSDPAAARGNLGLGGIATYNVADFFQVSNLFSEIPSINLGAARLNLGLGSASTHPDTDFDPAGSATTVQTNLTSHTGNISNPHSVTKTQVGLSAVANALQLVAASNLSDLANAGTARTNLGLGSSATHASTDFALSTTVINTTGPITGGGDISTTRTFAIAKATASVDGYLAAADFTTFASKANLTANTFTAAQTISAGIKAKGRVSTPVTLTDAATIATDGQSGDQSFFRVTIAGNRTLGNPTNAVDNQQFEWEIKQDATGSRTLSYDTKFEFSTEIGTFTIDATANKVTVIVARYNSAADKFRVYGKASKFS